MRVNRPAYSDLPEQQKVHSRARAYAREYLKRGKLVAEPCVRCGAKKAEKHRPDYTKPLLVIFMCRDCHLAAHQQPNVPHETFLASRNQQPDEGIQP